MTTFPSAIITGTGHALPSRRVTNAELSVQLGDDIAPFVSGTLGIDERWWCAEGESTADLAERAGLAAMRASGVDPSTIDLLIVATDTPEYVSPATSSVVQGRLGCTRAGTFDVNAGCAGFVTALDVGWKYLRADARYQRILIIGAYAMSRWLDPFDKKTVTIFADGAGAVVLERGPYDGVLASELYADGSLSLDMGIFAGGAHEPITERVLQDGSRHRLRFVRKYPASVNEAGWPRITRSVLARADAEPRDVQLWFWTQVNRSTIVEVMNRLDVPMERAHTIMHKWGYTGSACLPMALDDAVQQGRLHDGDLIVLTGSGAGLAMGSVAMRWRAVNLADRRAGARDEGVAP